MNVFRSTDVAIHAWIPVNPGSYDELGFAG